MTTSSEIAATTDVAIQEYPPREVSGFVDYRMGKISVSWRGGNFYFCGSCSWPDNYATPEHKGCAHIKRIVKYREEHAPDPAVMDA